MTRHASLDIIPALTEELASAYAALAGVHEALARAYTPGTSGALLHGKAAGTMRAMADRWQQDAAGYRLPEVAA